MHIENPDDVAGSKELVYAGNSPEKKELIEKFEELKKLRRIERKKGSSKYAEVDSIYGTPFLSFVDDLLLAVKENLIGELALYSSTRADKDKPPTINTAFKQQRFAETFIKLPNCKLKIFRAVEESDKRQPR